MAKAIYRFCAFDRTKIDKDKRTVPVVFSSEAACDRGHYDEILDHGAADLTRLKSKAPYLVNHNPDDHVGVIEDADIDGDARTGGAVVRFGKSARAEEIFQDTIDGIRPGVSVGYERTQAISRTKGANGRDVIRFAWAPFEISSASIPADLLAGVGRAQPIDDDPIPTDSMQRSLLFEAAAGNSGAGNGGGNAGTVTEIDREKIATDVQGKERNRVKNINAAAFELGKVYPGHVEKFRAMGSAAQADGTSAEKFNADLLTEIPNIAVALRDVAATGMSDKDKRRYSIVRAINLLANGEKLDGIEKEQHDEVAKRMNGMPFSSGNGFLVPTDIAIDLGSAARGRSRFSRDLTAGVQSQGGDFIQTTVEGAQLIEILRHKLVCDDLGVQTISGLQGNVAYPRQTGAATAYTLAESALLAISTQAINQITQTPHRVGAAGKYSKQLLLQSESVDVESFMREDLMKVLGLKIDQLILSGQGANSEPTGILNQTGIGAVTFGATATFAKAIAFETALATADADLGALAFLVDPATRGAWKQIAKIGTTFPNFLWEAGDYGKGTRGVAGEVNGYKAVASNQVTGSRCTFANWNDIILSLFGGFDILVNPYTYDLNAEVQISINAFIDVALRHAASVCASTDSANQ